jgi:hypothetical protein
MLDDAALQHALQHWRFTPGTENGKPVAMWYSVRAVFSLDQ